MFRHSVLWVSCRRRCCSTGIQFSPCSKFCLFFFCLFFFRIEKVSCFWLQAEILETGFRSQKKKPQKKQIIINDSKLDSKLWQTYILLSFSAYYLYQAEIISLVFFLTNIKQIVTVINQDILNTHCIIFPAFVIAAGSWGSNCRHRRLIFFLAVFI